MYLIKLLKKVFVDLETVVSILTLELSSIWKWPKPRQRSRLLDWKHCLKMTSQLFASAWKSGKR